MIALAYVAAVATSLVVLAVALCRCPTPEPPAPTPAPAVLPGTDEDVRVILDAATHLAARLSAAA